MNENLRAKEPGPKKNEVKVCGRHACDALYSVRRDDIVRVYVTEERKKEFAGLLRWCAAERKAYHVVADEDLERVAETVHHDGIAILAKQKESCDWQTFFDALKGEPAAKPYGFAFLDGVENPHNVGALLRSAAHFGIAAILVNAKAPMRLPPAVYRTAEGGAEYVDVIPVEDCARALAALKELGFVIVAATGDGARPLHGEKLPSRAVICLGAEIGGLTPRTRKLADVKIRIPGTGYVESLNVAAAGAVVFAEYFRQHGEEGERA